MAVSTAALMVAMTVLGMAQLKVSSSAVLLAEQSAAEMVASTGKS
jgi:hypothetical protein